MVIMIEASDFSVSSQEDSTDNYKPNTALHKSAAAPIPRQVSFNPMSICYDVMHLDDYSDDEMEASWFSADDFAKMREVARAEVHMLEAGLLVETRIRGLEHRTRQGIRRKRHSRERAYRAVFEEIDCQIDEEIIDEFSIAEAYYIHSRAAAIFAQRVAKKDAIEANKIYKKSSKGRVLLNKQMISKVTITSSAA